MPIKLTNYNSYKIINIKQFVSSLLFRLKITIQYTVYRNVQFVSIFQ